MTKCYRAKKMNAPIVVRSPTTAPIPSNVSPGPVGGSDAAEAVGVGMPPDDDVLPDVVTVIVCVQVPLLTPPLLSVSTADAVYVPAFW